MLLSKYVREPRLLAVQEVHLAPVRLVIDLEKVTQQRHDGGGAVAAVERNIRHHAEELQGFVLYCPVVQRGIEQLNAVESLQVGDVEQQEQPRQMQGRQVQTCSGYAGLKVGKDLVPLHEQLPANVILVTGGSRLELDKTNEGDPGAGVAIYLVCVQRL